MSTVYHNRHISGVCALLDGSDSAADARKAAVQAYEMYGDTLLLKREYGEANSMYTAMVKYCDRLVK